MDQPIASDRSRTAAALMRPNLVFILTDDQARDTDCARPARSATVRARAPRPTRTGHAARALGIIHGARRVGANGADPRTPSWRWRDPLERLRQHAHLLPGTPHPTIALRARAQRDVHAAEACCVRAQSRTEFFTGRYFHNVRMPTPDAGCMHANTSLVARRDTGMFGSLSDLGYNVGLFGKARNATRPPPRIRRPPPTLAPGRPGLPVDVDPPRAGHE